MNNGPLSSNELYDLLSEEVRRELAQREQTKTVPAGSPLLNQGVPLEHLIVVNQGRAELSVNSGRKTVVLGTVGKGKVLGLRAVVSGLLPEKNAVALEDCALTLIPRQDFLDVLRKHPEIYFAIAQVLSGDLKMADDVLRQLPRATAGAPRKMVRA